MKLKYHGDYKGEEQLPKGNLPENAVIFKEPDTPAKVNMVASMFIVPALVLVGAFMLLAVLVRGKGAIAGECLWSFPAVLVSFLTVVPHELLHGICFGKNSEVHMFTSWKNGMAFVVSTQPVSKLRFIMMSLCPNLIFGWIPLLVWAFVPFSAGISRFLFSFSIVCISFGVGDYMNVWNALRQMPKGSLQQLSGFHSYWYLPEEN